MTRVGFYFNAASKLEVARKLCVKAYQSGQCVLLYARDPRLASELDGGLWLNPALSFLPHVRSGHPLAKRTPVLIGDCAEEIASADVLINLDPVCPPFFERFGRVLEVVSEAPEDRQAARQRFRQYKERGFDPETIDLATR